MYTCYQHPNSRYIQCLFLRELVANSENLQFSKTSLYTLLHCSLKNVVLRRHKVLVCVVSTVVGVNVFIVLILCLKFYIIICSLKPADGLL